MSYHTPAPWTVNPEIAQIDGADGEPICQFLWPTLKRDFTETRANAALVASAPMMLKALNDYATIGGVHAEKSILHALSTYNALLKELMP